MIIFLYISIFLRFHFKPFSAACVKESVIRITNRITTKKSKNMKKIVFTLAAVMAFTFSFAKSDKADKRFDMSCDIYRLSEVLELDENQMDAVETIHDNFNKEMQSLAALKGPQLRFRIHQTVRKDAEQMRQVLNDKQLYSYMRIVMTTLRNRHL